MSALSALTNRACGLNPAPVCRARRSPSTKVALAGPVRVTYRPKVSRVACGATVSWVAVTTTIPPQVRGGFSTYILIVEGASCQTFDDPGAHLGGADDG